MERRRCRRRRFEVLAGQRQKQLSHAERSHILIRTEDDLDLDVGVAFDLCRREKWEEKKCGEMVGEKKRLNWIVGGDNTEG